MRSIRSSFPAPRRGNERGFALILALVLAVLYFMLIELLMLDASRELSEARRFRARIVALTLAENGAELAARQMVALNHADATETVAEGTFTGRMRKVAGTLGDEFDIVGTATSSGNESTNAAVHLRGRIEAGGRIVIHFAQHTQ